MTLKKRKILPLYSLGSSAIGGLLVHELTKNIDVDIQAVSAPHQDDHYQLLILKTGSGAMELEKHRIFFTAPAVMVIKPLQVHFLHNMSNAAGWTISSGGFLLPDRFTIALQYLDIKQQYQPLGDHEQINNMAVVLYNAFLKPHPYKTAILKGLSEALFHQVLSVYEPFIQLDHSPGNQSSAITHRFMQLLHQEQTMCTAAFLAEKMHITPAHLNDCIKASTGYPVTYWLQQTMLNTAKRLLYYTDKSVKEIAWELGFEDHPYFSRLFRKLTGETPGAFRSRFHE